VRIFSRFHSFVAETIAFVAETIAKNQLKIFRLRILLWVNNDLNRSGFTDPL
jgi:hypothetical protein